MAIHNKSHHNHALMSINKMRKDNKIKNRTEKDFNKPDKSLVCLNIMDCCDFLKEIPDASVQLICIDPPYNLELAGWDIYDNYIEWNAIERAHKNVHEIANLMLAEPYFSYILFLEGSNFLTQNITIEKPDGSTYTITYNDGTLNKMDRLTAANYGMPINTNLCENKFVAYNGLNIMLQAASIYTKGDGSHWNNEGMIEIMLDIARTSLRMIGKDLFKQLTK